MELGPAAAALAIQRKLRELRFAYFHEAVKRSPVVMSAFLRPTLLASLTRPELFPMLAAIVPWWLGQVIRGRRPGFWARLLHGGKLPGPNYRGLDGAWRSYEEAGAP